MAGFSSIIEGCRNIYCDSPFNEVLQRCCSLFDTSFLFFHFLQHKPRTSLVELYFTAPNKSFSASAIVGWVKIWFASTV